MGLTLENPADVAAPLLPLVSRTGYTAFSGLQTRPNNTTAYGAGDVLGVADITTIANAGLSILQFSFPGMPLAGPNGAEFMITTTELMRRVTAVIAGETSYSLYLYGTRPASNYLDNAVFDLVVTDLQFLGKVGLGTPVDEGSNLYISLDGIDKQITIPPSQNYIFGYLVTVGAYTPAALTVLSITLHGFLI